MIIHNEAIEAVNDGRSVPRRIGEFAIKYIATDGWRGYYDAVPTKKSRWQKVDADWVTGNWDDAGEHASDSVDAKVKAMEQKAIAEGKELAVVFTPTSNVFSTSYDVFVREVEKTDA